MPDKGPAPTHTPAYSLAPLAIVRLAIGGVLMGLANLVPGISGGTMLLAVGVYRAFVTAIADVTRLRLRPAALITLSVIVLSAVLAIALGAGLIKDLVINQRWVMYALFIGLTLGGVPIVWRLARPATPSVITGALSGIAVMAILAFTGTGSGTQSGFAMLTLAGAAGAAAMVLPGVSGGYLLLLLGQYVPILASIDRFKDALRAGDTVAAVAEWTTILPVGLGVLLGVALIANLVRFCLTRFEKPTLGVLLGLLLGSVLGLYPFQAPTPPAIGDTVKGRTIVEVTPEGSVIGQLTAATPDGSTTTRTEPVEAEDWPTATFTPSTTQVGAALGLILLGFLITEGIARLAPKEDRPSPETER